jgi:hypothetical protein
MQSRRSRGAETRRDRDLIFGKREFSCSGRTEMIVQLVCPVLVELCLDLQRSFPGATTQRKSTRYRAEGFKEPPSCLLLTK